MTNKDASLALQKAIFDALEAALSETVYDHVPQDAPKPYVEIGDIETVEWGDKDGDGTEHVARVRYYVDSHRGKKACRQIGQAVYDALHHQSLTVANNNLVLVQFLRSDVEKESDGLTYAGVSEFKVLTEFTG